MVLCNVYCSDKTNTQKLEMSAKIDVYSYRSAHRCASCSAGRTVGVVGQKWTFYSYRWAYRCASCSGGHTAGVVGQ